MARVCALVEAGGVAWRNPLLPPLGRCLAARGVELLTWDPTGAFELPPAAPVADLYLLKGDHPAVLTAASCLADAGGRFLNSFDATVAASDKARTLSRLALAGLPVPQSTLISDRELLADALAAGPRFVKPVRGAHGSGARLLAPGEAALACSGPWLVQEPIAAGRHDIKVYGVGANIAVRAVPFVQGRVDSPREPVPDADPAFGRIAVAAARVCGLECFGADFLVGAHGPVLVDLNALPGYRSVTEAPLWVAEAVLAELRRVG